MHLHSVTVRITDTLLRPIDLIEIRLNRHCGSLHRRTNTHAAAGSVLPQEHVPEMRSTEHLYWRLGGALSALGVLGKVCLPGKCVLGGPEDLLPEVRHSLLLSILSINTLAVLSHSARSKWPACQLAMAAMKIIKTEGKACYIRAPPRHFPY